MGILDELLGGGGGQRRSNFEDFLKRYEQGHPADGYSDSEVVERYQEVAHEVPQEDYAAAAQEALARLSPEERAELVKMLQERARTRGVTLPRQMGSGPRELGDVMTDLHKKPGQLRDMLGGGNQPQASGGSGGLSDMLASPLARAALAGIAAMVVKRYVRR
jgi:hypothetical protein